MRDAELRAALEPVREHFYGREVTVNTVLAAHLRAHGLPASGQPWERAKESMASGAGFDQAVAAAEEVAAVEATDLSRIPADAAAHSGRWALDWFPKQFGPGDIDGMGARRLLGTPNIDPAWLFVRETGQNSWDARGASRAIDFTLNLRRLDAAAVRILRQRVFTGDPPRSGLPGLLDRHEAWALEVSDRGTVGLTGPTRNDRAVDPGEDTNFIDLVLNIGAPRDVHLGGGTYGFGKAITYVASGVGTILIWSRCEGPDGIEHRLIGTAIGDGFDRDGRRYTGRHWWGIAFPDERRVEPVVGEAARQLAEQVFAARYPNRSTGTSILILDPQLGGTTPQEDAHRLAEAVTWNLWPKLLADQGDRCRMRISVQLNGQSVPLPAVEDHPVLSGPAHCLLAVRSAQSPNEGPAPAWRYPVSVHEIWCRLPETLLGHLALTRYPIPHGVAYPSHSIILMRHQAELVVRPLDMRELDVEGFQWAGVFKPVAGVDDSFAMAEPPAHDDWVPKAVADKPRRREVNVALQRIRETADEWLNPRPRERTATGDTVSVARIGDMLSGLLVGLEGPAPSALNAATGTTSAGTGRSRGPGVGSSRGGQRTSQPRVEFAGTIQVPAPDQGWTRTTLDVQLTDAAATDAVVDVFVRVAIDGGSSDDDSAIRVLGWHDGSGEAFDPHAQQLGPGRLGHYTFDSRADLAIDVQTRMVDR